MVKHPQENGHNPAGPGGDGTADGMSVGEQTIVAGPGFGLARLV